VGFTPNSIQTEPIPMAFEDAAAQVKAADPKKTQQKFPEFFSHFEGI
jgi:hypothetical protein